MAVRLSLRASISALALSAAVSPAFAQQFYGGLLAEYGNVDVDLLNDSGRLSALSGVVGVRTDVGGGPSSWAARSRPAWPRTCRRTS